MPTTFLKQLRHTYNLPRLQEACINNKQINDAFTGQKLYIFDLQNFLDKLASPANMQKCIDLQRKAAGDVTIDQFKNVFENCAK